MRSLLVITLLLIISACSTGGKYPIGHEFTPEENLNIAKVGKPYTVKGQKYYPTVNNNYSEEGIASWYGPNFHARATANNETFDKYAMTAAHKTLPMPSVARVTNLENGRSVAVRINDRGPFVPGRIIDVSRRAAEKLGFIGNGTAHVRVDYLPEETALLFPSGKNPYEKFGHTSYARLENANLGPGTAVPDTFPDESGVEDAANLYNERNKKEKVVMASLPVAGSPSAGNYPFKVGQSFTDDKNSNRSYYIQAALFESKGGADSAARNLLDLGRVDIVPVSYRGRVVYGVRVGPWNSTKMTDQKLDMIITNYGFKDAFVIGN